MEQQASRLGPCVGATLWDGARRHGGLDVAWDRRGGLRLERHREVRRAPSAVGWGLGGCIAMEARMVRKKGSACRSKRS